MLVYAIAYLVSTDYSYLVWNLAELENYWGVECWFLTFFFCAFLESLRSCLTFISQRQHTWFISIGEAARLGFSQWDAQKILAEKRHHPDMAELQQ